MVEQEPLLETRSDLEDARLDFNDLDEEVLGNQIPPEDSY